MKAKIQIFMILTVALFFTTGAMAANFTIDDRYDQNGIYWGGHAFSGNSYSGGGDLVGTPEQFEISQVDVNISQYYRQYYHLQIDIHSVFMSYLNNNPSSPVEFGDVFLSNDGWNPDTTGVNHEFDTPLNGEDWEYVLVLDDHTFSTTSGTFDLYAVDENMILNSDDLLDPSIGIRAGQEVQYDITGQQRLNYRSWQQGNWTWYNWDTPDASDDYLTLTMYYYWGYLGLDDDMGIHVTMTCANDIVEGGDEIPEPATMMLFGVGLAGLAGSSIRRRKKK